MFASDGSCAVEAALKIALQYWVNQGEQHRTRFITLEDGYHGDTLGAVGVGYIEDIPPAVSAGAATCVAGRFALLQSLSLPAGSRDLPSGMLRFDGEVGPPPPPRMRRRHRGTALPGRRGHAHLSGRSTSPFAPLCDQYRLLLIADEIAVGFGRTGALFACQQAGIVPDIMTVGKGLTGGMLPMSATLVTDALYDTFRALDGHPRTFFHGHTFCGNPIASATALAALAVYEEEHVVERLNEPVPLLQAGMRSVAELLDGSPLRTLGMIAAIEIKESAGGGARARRIVARAYELGLFIRPLGSVVYLWPPLTISSEDLQQMLAILSQATRET